MCADLINGVAAEEAMLVQAEAFPEVSIDLTFA
jgi:hypothetical protein